MKLYGIVPYVIGLLQWAGRVSYHALQVEFGLDAETLEALKVALIQVQQLAVDQDGTMLIWVGGERRLGQLSMKRFHEALAGNIYECSL